MKFMLTMMTLLFTTVSFAQHDRTVPVVSGVASLGFGVAAAVRNSNKYCYTHPKRTIYMGSSYLSEDELIKRGILTEKVDVLTRESAEKIKESINWKPGDKVLFYGEYNMDTKYRVFSENTYHDYTTISSEEKLAKRLEADIGRRHVYMIEHVDGNGFRHYPQYGRSKFHYNPGVEAAMDKAAKKATPIIVLYSLVSLLTAAFSVEELISGNHYSKALVNRIHSAGRDSGKDLKEVAIPGSGDLKQARHQ